MKPIFLRREPDRPCIGHGKLLVTLAFTTFLCLSRSWPAVAQVPFEETAPGRFRVEFINKDHNLFSLNDPQQFLSVKCLARRARQGIPVSYNDLPVTAAYIDSVRATGATILTVSRWFNAVTVIAPEDSILRKILKLSFVKKIPAQKIMPGNKRQVSGGIQTIETEQEFDYGISGWQTAIHKGNILHDQEFTGRGITIAVIDAGFYHVDQLPAFSSLWENDQIIGTRDFVAAGSNVYNGNSHGMVVLSILGGNLPGELIGAAPDAAFWLLRSEDTGSEFIIEEDNWAAAAEFADSAGADIISSSLGYFQFDNPAMNHTYGDMDGNTTRVSRAADIAASKGMLVVVSAGNQGINEWHYISSPADADSVISVGAIDGNGYIANFSSRGPSSDMRIKPDVVAIGKGTWMADFVSGIRQGNGTSLSAPVIAGLSACLWQADPNATAMEMLAAIKESGDHYTHPDNDFGYGIPDFNLAHVLLKQHESGSPSGIKIIVFPNPFNNELYLVFPSPVDERIDVSLLDLSGREVFHASYPQFSGRSHIVIDRDLKELVKGVYLLKVKTGTKISNSKLVKF